MKKFPKKLNLGCGHYPKDGFLNIDISKDYPADLIHDLEVFPWPLPDNHFEFILMDHVFEHLTDLRKTITELDRILTKGGILNIKVPHFTRGFTHWDHKHGFDVTFPIYFDKDSSGGFNKVELKHVSTNLKWFAQHDLKKKHLSSFSYYSGRTIGVILDLVGNLNHYFTSRILSYWVGGYDEIEFILQK